jgi:pilus assembly protein CpaB
MNRRLRTIIVLAIAVVCATVATAGVVLYIKSRPPVVVLAPQAKVMVAARPVATGICLGEDDVKEALWPANTPVAGAFAERKDVIGRGLMAGVAENEPLTNAKLAPKEAGCGLPPSIHAGMRAVSVRVNEVIGVAGFVVPGARVDVLVTIRQDNTSRSRIVVPDAQVLTAGTRYDQDQAKDGKAISVTVVTLMVNPEDAERLALAAAEGQILLTLRNPLDVDKPRTPGVSTATLLVGDPGPLRPSPLKSAEATPPVRRRPAPKAVDAVPAVVPPPPPPGPYVVETIRKGAKQQEVVQGRGQGAGR